MKDEKKVIKESRTVQEPKVSMERRTVMEPKVVQKVVEEPRTIVERKVTTESRMVERISALTCSNITGIDVINQSGDKLGKIDDVMIDIRSGRVIYAVLSYGGGFMSAGKLLALPWEAFTVENAETYADEDVEHRFVIDIPKDKLDDAPGFDKDNWPREPDQSWMGNLYSRYGYTSRWRENELRSSETMRHDEDTTNYR